MSNIFEKNKLIIFSSIAVAIVIGIIIYVNIRNGHALKEIKELKEKVEELEELLEKPSAKKDNKNKLPKAINNETQMPQNPMQSQQQFQNPMQQQFQNPMQQQFQNLMQPQQQFQNPFQPFQPFENPITFEIPQPQPESQFQNQIPKPPQQIRQQHIKTQMNFETAKKQRSPNPKDKKHVVFNTEIEEINNEEDEENEEELDAEIAEELKDLEDDDEDED